jgi:hypothetical protein
MGTSVVDFMLSPWWRLAPARWLADGAISLLRAALDVGQELVSEADE